MRDLVLVKATAISCLAFCFISSSIYCLNDIIDVNDDRLHPFKQQRPIASGQISILQGYVLMILSLSLGIFIALFLPSENILRVEAVLMLYWILNILYCLILKSIPLVDVFVISLGFVLRVLAGSVATGIHASRWIIMMTFLVCTFIAFAKRRDDVVRFNTSGVKLRKNTDRYNIPFINSAMTITGTITIVCYIMYTVSPEVVAVMNTQYLYVTSLFVFAGIMRYLQKTLVYGSGGNPTRIALTDKYIVACMAIWVISFIIILYL